MGDILKVENREEMGLPFINLALFLPMTKK